jgi:hypothetical protein
MRLVRQSEGIQIEGGSMHSLHLVVSRTKAAPRFLGRPGHTLASADLCRASLEVCLVSKAVTAQLLRLSHAVGIILFGSPQMPGGVAK